MGTVSELSKVSVIGYVDGFLQQKYSDDAISSLLPKVAAVAKLNSRSTVGAVLPML